MIRHLIAERSAGVAVFVALALPVIIGMGALGTEVSMWLLTQRSMQGAADAAVISASFARASLTTMQNQAYAVAAQNGYTNGVNGVTVAVHNPPTKGNFTGNNKAIEVVISQTQSLLFSALFLGADPTVAARAVSAPAANGGGCMLALGGGTSIVVSGNGNVVLSGCDADGNGSLSLSGKPSSLSANSVDITGTESGQGTLSTTQAPTYNDPTPFPDPYAARSPSPQSVVAAMPASCAGTFPTSGSATPGCFHGGITVTADLSMAAGRYYIDGKYGAFTQTGGKISGTGVTIILTSSTPGTASSIATFALSGGGKTPEFAITAPTDSTDPLAGIVVIQDNRAVTTSTGAALSGQVKMSAVGALYFPDSTISFSGQSTLASTCLEVVGLNLQFSGNAAFQANCVGTGVAGFGRDGAVRLTE